MIHGPHSTPTTPVGIAGKSPLESPENLRADFGRRRTATRAARAASVRELSRRLRRVATMGGDATDRPKHVKTGWKTAARPNRPEFTMGHYGTLPDCNW